MVLGGALGPGLGACDAAPLCVAGVAQTHIQLASTVVLRGRRETDGTASGMFRLSACVGMLDFGIGMFKRFLLSDCYVLRHV